MTDTLDLASRLIACRSVTPEDAGALDVLGDALRAIGFTVESFVSGEAPDGPVRNLFATRGSGGPHFAFAGHSDVVPPGDGWSGDAFRPEVVLLDIGLPGRNGYDVCRELRLQPWGPQLTIIALTGWGQTSDRRKSEDAGFDRHLVKPVDPDLLIQMVHEHGRRQH